MLDSLLVLEAINNSGDNKTSDNINNLVFYLMSCQNDDGSWGYNEKSGGDPVITARVGLAINRYMSVNYLYSDDVNTALTDADTFLSSYGEEILSQQNAEQQIYLYMYKHRNDTIKIEDTFISNLISAQNKNGSFYDDIHLTVLATRLIAYAQKKNISPIIINNMKLTLDDSSCFVNNNHYGYATVDISYSTTADAQLSLVISLKDGDDVIKTQSYNVLATSENTLLTVQPFEFDICSDEQKKYDITAELLLDDEKVAQDSTEFNVRNKSKLTDILLIQSTLPWNSNANSIVLDNLGFSYDLVKSAQASDIDFSKYRLIIVGNDQYTNTYNDLFAMKDKLTQFVADGGTLVYGVCDSGWASGMSNAMIPGDITIGPVAYIDNNYIVNSNHPIVTAELSDGIPLINANLYNNHANHRYFNIDSLPEGTDIILNDGNPNQPTLVEYNIGKGVVIASALTWEHAYAYRGSDIFGQRALDDLFLYAYSIIFADTTFNTTSDINTDKESYYSEESIKIHADTSISTFQCRADYNVEILDENDNVIAEVASGNEKLVASSPWECDFDWAITDIMAGTYKARITWTSGDNVLSVSETSFDVLPDGDVVNTVATDKKEYTEGEKVSVTDKIVNTSLNSIQDNLNLEITVTDENSDVVDTFAYDKITLGLKDSKKYNNISENLKCGNYKIISVLMSGDKELDVSSCNISIVAKPVIQSLVGDIDITNRTLSDLTLDYIVKNIGNIDMSNVTIQADVYTGDGYTQVSSFTDKDNISVDKLININHLVDTDTLTEGCYLVVLNAVLESGEKIKLANTGFILTTQPSTSPSDNNESESTTPEDKEDDTIVIADPTIPTTDNLDVDIHDSTIPKTSHNLPAITMYAKITSGTVIFAGYKLGKKKKYKSKSI